MFQLIFIVRKGYCLPTSLDDPKRNHSIVKSKCWIWVSRRHPYCKRWICIPVMLPAAIWMKTIILFPDPGTNLSHCRSWFYFLSHLSVFSDKKVALCEWKTEAGFVELPYSPITQSKYGVTKVKFLPQEGELLVSSADGSISIFNADVCQENSSKSN